MTADTPVLVRYHSYVYVTAISKINLNQWNPYEEFEPFESNRREKEQCVPNGLEVWTHQGWKQIKRVIRHKCVKDIYRVISRHGFVDVTEDHSLLNRAGKLIPPMECLNEELLYSYPVLTRKNSVHILSRSNAMIRRRFCLDGDGGDTSQVNLAKFYKNLKEKTNNSVEFEMIGGKLYVVQQNEFIQRPNDVLGLIKLRSTGSNEFVYDLETEAGTFQAGVGELIVKNTDSIFINFHIKDENGKDRTDKEALIQSIAKAKESCDTYQ